MLLRHLLFIALIVSSSVLAGCEKKTLEISPQARSLTLENQDFAKRYAQQTNDALIRANPLPKIKIDSEHQSSRLTESSTNLPEVSNY
jgi:outer membrane murein-binding lipoprotein Lpp